MKAFLLFSLLLTSSLFAAPPEDEQQLKALYNTALTQGKAYAWLRHLTTQIGARLSGTVQAEQAVAYTQRELEALGLDRVWLQPVHVPKWVRGTPEFAYMETQPGHTTSITIAALGGSVATPQGGLKASVIEVQGIEDLEKLGKDTIAGKIVFYNRPMDPTQINTFAAYANGVDQRYNGAAQAAKYGAVGVLVRSLNLRLDDYPHTGAMQYENTPLANRIPAAAISTQGAELLSATLRLQPNVKFYFRQSCRQLPEVTSYNVIGEIRGSHYPDEIIVVGAHLDSWDLGEGAHNNGAGCVQSMEVLRLFRRLGYTPKRTLRVVLFANGMQGLSGARRYAERAKAMNERHVFALESDAGGFRPSGFYVEGAEKHLRHLHPWKSYFAPYGVHLFAKGYGGANISLLQNGALVLAGLRTASQRYFDYHYAETDTFASINPRELQLGAATMAALVYFVDRYGLGS